MNELRRCDRVVVMEAGEVVEVGTPNQLLLAPANGSGDSKSPTSGHFRRLVDELGPELAHDINARVAAEAES
jgi:ABC-type glutathione transport system ATPase component